MAFRHILLIVFVCTFINLKCQTPMFSLLQTEFAIELGGAVIFSKLPSQINSREYTQTYITEDLYFANSYVAGIKGNVAISPIYTDYFSYSFTTNGMVGWLLYNSQSNFYMGHLFKLGTPRFKIQAEFGKFRFRTSSFYSIETPTTFDMIEKIGFSSYDDMQRISLGAHITFQGDQTLSMSYITEKYADMPESEKPYGFLIEYGRADKLSFFADVVFQHPITGAFIVGGSLSDFDIPSTGTYFVLGMRKHLFYKKRYFRS